MQNFLLFFSKYAIFLTLEEQNILFIVNQELEIKMQSFLALI